MSPTADAKLSRRRSRRAPRDAGPPGSPAAELAAASPGLRMRPVRPIRVVAGLLLVASAVVAGLALYTRLGDRTEVLALTQTVLAGEQIGPDDLRVVSIGSDDAITTVSASQREAIVGQYARVRLAGGSLLFPDAVQARPLVDPDRVLMAVEVPAGQVPVGLRERSRVVLIVLPRAGSRAEEAEAITVEATVVAVPSDLAQLVGQGQQGQSSLVSLSVEVPPDQVAIVGMAELVSIGVLDPSSDFTVSAESIAEPAADAVSPQQAAPTTTAGGGG